MDGVHISRWSLNRGSNSFGSAIAGKLPCRRRRRHICPACIRRDRRTKLARPFATKGRAPDRHGGGSNSNNNNNNNNELSLSLVSPFMARLGFVFPLLLLAFSLSFRSSSSSDSLHPEPSDGSGSISKDPLNRGRSRYEEPLEYEEDEEWEGGRWQPRRRESERRYEEAPGGYREQYEPERFVLDRFTRTIRTEAGEMHTLPRHASSEFSKRRIGLGFLRLEPKALLLPQYTDADCLFIVFKGKGRFSWIDDGDLQEVDLEEGDVFKIDRGTVFHFFNKDEGERLHVFSIHDIPLEVDSKRMFHNFFVAGGLNPESILSGFSEDVLATVFNVSADEVHDTLSSQTQGSIILFKERNESRKEESYAKSFANRWLNLYAANEEQEAKNTAPHAWMNVISRYLTLPGIFSKDSRKKPFNILKAKPAVSNEYGSATSADERDFELLKDVNKGVFAVKLKAGAVLAPHWNPRAMEIGLVTKGEGEIQIVYPNGSAAASERVEEGTVFYVPQNYPMCQIASRSGPLEFLGFTTSSIPNNPQFLAGPNSVLKKLNPEVLASSFNLPIEHVQKFIGNQFQAVILPGQPMEPPKQEPSKP